MQLSLGTAQFGMKYGISNNKKHINKKEINQILDYSLKKNILNIDTAKSYGDAEKRLGQYKNIKKFHINTKISKINTIQDIHLIKNQINDSLKNLKINSINVCYIHYFKDIKNIKKGKKIFLELLKLKKEKKIKSIGISLYSLKELKFCLKNYKFNSIQIPVNIINQDFNNEDILNEVKKRNIKIEVRSIFLQGIVFLDPLKLKQKFKPLKNKLIKLRELENNNKKILTYCIKFVRQNKSFDKVVVGVTSLTELKIILKCFNIKKYNRNNYYLFKSSSRMKNPSNW